MCRASSSVCRLLDVAHTMSGHKRQRVQESETAGYQGDESFIWEALPRQQTHKAQYDTHSSITFDRQHIKFPPTKGMILGTKQNDTIDDEGEKTYINNHTHTDSGTESELEGACKATRRSLIDDYLMSIKDTPAPHLQTVAQAIIDDQGVDKGTIHLQVHLLMIWNYGYQRTLSSVEAAITLLVPLYQNMRTIEFKLIVARAIGRNPSYISIASNAIGSTAETPGKELQDLSYMDNAIGRSTILSVFYPAELTAHDPDARVAQWMRDRAGNEVRHFIRRRSRKPYSLRLNA